ncbi:uncharacterized protein TrAtP1_009016 [Trichoderma atroviride]|uniref:uncharacterized protein n=1 Tax=Hypocrea atroviridis TaxID=63577 RepID=UPI003316A14F|nr:hypothetical protein TrAtP1_009016 [Trichoderma atroviride]
MQAAPARRDPARGTGTPEARPAQVGEPTPAIGKGSLRQANSIFVATICRINNSIDMYE